LCVQAFDKGKKVADSSQWFFEVSWEVANKVGGIYTVLKTKAFVTTQELGDQYCLIGPYREDSVWMEVENLEPIDGDPAQKAVQVGLYTCILNNLS